MYLAKINNACKLLAGKWPVTAKNKAGKLLFAIFANVHWPVFIYSW